MANFLQLQKHVFSAYVNSNRPEEVLERYEQANPQERRIPITGVLSLLRKFPNLTGRVEKLVRRNAENGDMRPAVALWSYLFGERKFDHAKNLLEEYPSISLHLRAMPICERAHENNDTELLRKLIETLREHSRPNVALAYSYLIGLNCHNRDYRAGLSVLKEAQDEAGLALHELRLTALRILEKGLVQMGQVRTSLPLLTHVKVPVHDFPLLLHHTARLLRHQAIFRVLLGSPYSRRTVFFCHWHGMNWFSVDTGLDA